MHLLSNCLLFAGLTSQMERKYGSWHIVLLWVLSALGGNLFRCARWSCLGFILAACNG